MDTEDVSIRNEKASSGVGGARPIRVDDYEKKIYIHNTENFLSARSLWTSALHGSVFYGPSSEGLNYIFGSVRKYFCFYSGPAFLNIFVRTLHFLINRCLGQLNENNIL